MVGWLFVARMGRNLFLPFFVRLSQIIFWSGQRPTAAEAAGGYFQEQ